MAKQNATHRTTKRASRAEDLDSLLIRSAESLGRIIGDLQRQFREILPDGYDGAATAKKKNAKNGARKSTAQKRSPGK